MSAWTYVGGGLAVVAAVVVVGGLVMSDEFGSEASQVVEAPPEVAFAFVNDVRNHEKFNPWKAKDPTMAVTYPGPTEGQGAVYAWTSENSGNGTTTFVAVTEPSRIDTKVVFEGMGEGDGYWLVEPADGGSKVTWGFTSAMGIPVLGPWMVVAFDPGGATQKDFEAALVALKPLVEAEAKAQAEAAAAAAKAAEEAEQTAKAGEDGAEAAPATE